MAVIIRRPATTGERGAARPRAQALLDDTGRAAFLSEWDAVQSGFATDPQQSAKAAELLVGRLADSVVQRICEITDAVAHPPADPSSAPAGSSPGGVPVPDEETWRRQLLRCREAFHMLIDS